MMRSRAAGTESRCHHGLAIRPPPMPPTMRELMRKSDDPPCPHLQEETSRRMMMGDSDVIDERELTQVIKDLPVNEVLRY